MPSRSEVHIDKALSNFSIGYAQGLGMFINEQAFPTLPVTKESDKYFTYYLKDVITPPVNAIRAPGAEAQEIDFNLTNSSYSCEEYARKKFLPDRTKKLYDPPLEAERATVRILTQQLMVLKERRVATTLFDATTFASYYSALGTNDKWDAYTASASDPIEDILVTAKPSIRQNCLMPANTVILGAAVFEALQRHPSILDLIKYGGSTAKPTNVTPAALAAIFQVDKVLVGNSVYNSANIGQTVTAANIWGSYAMVAYIAPRPTTEEPTLGLQFQSQPLQIIRYRVPERKGEMFEISEVVDPVVTCTGAAYLFGTVVS